MPPPVADCVSATIVVALLLLPLWLPRAPTWVQVPVALLVLLGGFLFGISSLRTRWRLSKSTGQFVGYYLYLVGVALAIIVVFLLLCIPVARMFSR